MLQFTVNSLKTFINCSKYLCLNNKNYLTNNTMVVNKQQKRYLNLLECDSKILLKKYGINIQDFVIVNDKNDIENIKNIDADEYVVKAQILAGGRGLGYFDNGYKSGVHITNKLENIEMILKNMIGHRLITKQTSKNGTLVRKVTVAKSVKIKNEKYFCILLDSSYNGPIAIGSANGGTDIEELAKRNDEKLIKIFPIDITKGITQELAEEISTYLNFKKSLRNKATKQIISLWKLFTNIDATQIEINPFAETADDKIIAVDAKINFDDNATFRQKDIQKMYEEIQRDEYSDKEIIASKHNLNYIGLEGNIGCLVNGAGLAMATMDIIKLYGGEPANFLDVGGNVNKDQVLEAFKILTSDEKVKTILINIFGGIVNCSIIANGIINAMKQITLDKISLIVRLEGNNVAEGKQLLENSNLPIKFASNLDEAAELAVKNA